MNDYFLSRDEITELQDDLLDWFRDNSREFPWRKTSNPFHILIAEKLLQQTSAGERVVNAYLSIVTKYPTSSALSKVEIEELNEIVAPLGLLYRAQELINLASAIEIQFSGKLPDEYKSLMRLPGVGEEAALNTIVSPGISTACPLGSSPIRIFGPARSCRIASGLPSRAETARTQPITCAYNSWSPYEKFKRATSIPASAKR